MEIITLKEAATILKYVDIRSVVVWCNRNKVKIFLDDGAKRKYLNRLQFERARLKNFVQYLKSEYKEKWLDAFKAHMNLNLLGVIEMEENFKLNLKNKTEEYKPAGYNENLFLTRLTNLIAELK
jgi:hypothetical protein